MKVWRSLHLPPKQSDEVRDVVYSALTALAEGDSLEGLDIKVADE